MGLGRDARDAQAIYWEFGEEGSQYQPSGRKERNDAEHTTKEGEVIKVKDMEDSHLYYSYLCLGDNKYLKEMVLRLFEERLI
ncbi:hypothetical protein [Flexistipes sp.]|uniref:hypothetical protein n=1 Tax=Flexistipes sp. TaxID=3088135 RepID=UPI002E228367|nr:hypothetical protein [Flexistipes sp.]